MTGQLMLKMAQANLLTLLRDRKALIMLLAIPVLITAVLSFALGNVFGSNPRIPSFPVAVYNEDSGSLGTGLVRVLRSQSGQMTVHVEDSLAGARADTTTDKANVVVWIGRNYTQQIESGHKATVDVESTSAHSVQRSVVQSIVQSYGQEFADKAYTAGQLPGSKATIESANIQSRTTSLHPVTTGAYYAIGMMVMFMLTNAINRAGAMVRDKRSDLYRRMMASPASRYAIAGGHLVSNFVILALYGAVLLLCYRFILNIHLGPIDQTAMILVAYSLALSGISVALGSWISNIRIMDSLGQIGSQVACILGGSFWPLYGMPKGIQVIAHGLPNGEVLTALVNSIIGINSAGLLTPVLYLVCLGVICGLLGSLRYGRSIETGGAAG
ncbi:ABC transporter permease [Alicyclobacillus dauci]|uniref:ABC transporter permease n=1 Tax=Alicyclobacillus dauci TaxID=1475485 RepID=A0ABY6Z5R5_9BACL|nr:ABC transporter permease [Alicyclobacillus dauci]WAH38224.1 ABC transporter permease [Alicyclobacillus dauci]